MIDSAPAHENHLSIESLQQTEVQTKFIHRDISWLEFNRRVLHEATDARTPLLERLMFLGIFTSNLDEFFMKRARSAYVRSSLDQPFDESERQHLQTLREMIMPMLREQAQCFQADIKPALADHGIHLLAWDELSADELELVYKYFRQNVFPIMTPQSVDPSHPFPFISNLSDSLAVALRHPETKQRLFARVKIPHQIPQWIELAPSSDSKQRRFASLRDLISNNLSDLFPGMDVQDVLPLRVTRSAEVNPEHIETEDLLEQVERELRQRRLQHVVRLEHASAPNKWLLDQVVRELHLIPEQVYELPGEMDYTDFRRIASLPMSELRYPAWTPAVPPQLPERQDIFASIRRGDIMVHHPYDSFDASVARFIRSAVDDENVWAIKLTLYRTSDDTPFVPWLIEAAEEGKQVVCLVELKARFDEHRNIRWANALEDAGVHVVYGLIGKKTHTKMALVVRRESEKVRCYAHIGTGNYHPQTARLYTDLGLFTCDPAITEDVVELFHYLTGRSLKKDYRQLLVAPTNMKRRFLEMIDREIEMKKQERPARIIAKMNQLEDRDVCRALYRASQAGVEIDLIIRGFSILRPRLPDLSPTIRITSVIGRFLEHSRIFYFRNGAQREEDGEFFIGSADWMHRNLEDRVEAIVPVTSETLREELWQILQITMNDQRQAWDMQSDGSYVQRTPPSDAEDSSSTIGTHQTLLQLTSERSAAE